MTSTQKKDDKAAVDIQCRYQFCLVMDTSARQSPQFVCAMGRLDRPGRPGTWHTITGFEVRKTPPSEETGKNSLAVFAPFIPLKLTGHQLSLGAIPIPCSPGKDTPLPASSIGVMYAAVASMREAEEYTLDNAAAGTWCRAFAVFCTAEQAEIYKEYPAWRGLYSRLFLATRGKQRAITLQSQPVCTPEDIHVCDLSRINRAGLLTLTEDTVSAFLAKIIDFAPAQLLPYSIMDKQSLLDCCLSLCHWRDQTYIPSDRERASLADILPAQAICPLEHDERTSPPPASSHTLKISDRQEKAHRASHTRRFLRAAGLVAVALLGAVLIWMPSAPRSKDTQTLKPHMAESSGPIPLPSADTFGVVVGPFNGRDPEIGKTLQDSFARVLKGRVVEMGLRSVKIRTASADECRLFDDVNTCSALLTNADKLVVWGDVAENRIIAYLLTSDKSSWVLDCGWAGLLPQRVVTFTETAAVGDLRMKALTELPVAVVALAAGRRELEEENLDEALRHFRDVAGVFPRDPGVWMEIGRTYLLMHQQSNAIASINKAIEVAPTNSVGYLYRASLHLMNGNKALFLADLDTADRLAPGSTTIFRFAAYDRQEDYSNAILTANALINDNTANMAWYWYLQRAKVYFKSGSTERALEDIDNASASPVSEIKLPLFRWGRGAAYMTVGEYEKAEMDLDSAIQKMPQEAELYFQRAKVYEALNQPDKAAADLTHAAQIAGHHPSVLLRVATAFDSLHMNGNAIAFYQRFMEIAPPWASEDTRFARKTIATLKRIAELTKEKEALLPPLMRTGATNLVD